MTRHGQPAHLSHTVEEAHDENGRPYLHCDECGETFDPEETP